MAEEEVTPCFLAASRVACVLQVGLGLSAGRHAAVPSGVSTSAPATLRSDATAPLRYLLGVLLHGNQSCPPCPEAAFLPSFAGCLMAFDLL